MPVNIDSQAQLADDVLTSPWPDMFKTQQLQVQSGNLEGCWLIMNAAYSQSHRYFVKLRSISLRSWLWLWVKDEVIHISLIWGSAPSLPLVTLLKHIGLLGGHLGLFTKGPRGSTTEINTNWHTPTEHTALYTLTHRHAVKDLLTRQRNETLLMETLSHNVSCNYILTAVVYPASIFVFFYHLYLSFHRSSFSRLHWPFIPFLFQILGFLKPHLSFSCL